MLVRISTGEDQGDTLHHFYHWLRRDEDVRRMAKVTAVQPDADRGAMGAVEYINVGCTMVSVLLSAYSTWRTTRPSDPPIQMTVNGTTVVLTDTSPDTLRRAAAQLEASEGDGEPRADRAPGE